MKKVWTYFAIGCVLAIAGMFFSDICGNFFNGMDYGSACLLGMGMYLCIVVVTCTGIIVSKVTCRKKRTIPKKKTSKPIPVYRSSSAGRLNKAGESSIDGGAENGPFFQMRPAKVQLQSVRHDHRGS